MTETPSTIMPTTTDLLNNPQFRHAVRALADDVKLGNIWNAFLNGRGVTKEEAELVMLDLLVTSGFFEIAPDSTSAEVLQRREGRREIAGRIFFLADLPFSYITKARQQALDALQKMNEG